MNKEIRKSLTEAIHPFMTSDTNAIEVASVLHEFFCATIAGLAADDESRVLDLIKDANDATRVVTLDMFMRYRKHIYARNKQSKTSRAANS